jgi:hypothetical protein
MMTREWIEYEIAALGRELERAERLLPDAVRKMNSAIEEYNDINGSISTFTGCIRGWKEELRFMDKVEAAAG